MKIKKTIQFLLTITLLLGYILVYSQQETQPFGVYGKGKVKNNVILLKWAVNDPILWKKSLTTGYKIQRTTITRDGNPIGKDETVILSEKLLPLPLQDWEALAQNDSIALIVAQALYGEEFQVTPPQQGVTSVMMLNDQNQQRYAFALMAAEQSYTATKAAGWGIEDATAKPNEKYVYTITLLGVKDPVPPATIYIGLNDSPDTTVPNDLEAIFGNQTAMIVWEYQSQKALFNSYTIEKSEDGSHFTRLNKSPIFAWENKSSVLSYTDPLTQNDKTYYYRIRGIDSFGDISNPSKTISGKGVAILEYSPQIVAKHIENEDEVTLEWEFPIEGQDKITMFQILKADSEDGNFELVKDQIAPITRKDRVKTPLKPSNYFLIKAIAPNGTFRSSFPTLVQPIDSIPPLPPIGLTGEIDAMGVVKLRWNKNLENDLSGYKLFRGNSPNEEFAQVTKAVWLDTQFKDSINIKSLNHNVYYKLIAVDKRYNESSFSKILELKKPDKIPPTSPVIADYEIKENAIHIQFIQSTSDDIQKHTIFRRTDKELQWIPVFEFEDKKITEFEDFKIDANRKYYYTLVATDTSGNESEPSEPLIVSPLPKLMKPAIKNLGFFVDRTNKNIEIYWSSKEKNIIEYQLYKRKKGAVFSLYRILEAKEKVRFIDEMLSPGNSYQYAVKAVFADGTSSKIEEITVEY